MKTISQNDYFKLLGLLVLAEYHHDALTRITEIAERIVGDHKHGHIDAAVWGGETNIQNVLDKLGIATESA
jgi:hypothetical protein